MKTGDKLPNGAIVIAEQAGVILAAYPEGLTPYAIWRWDGTDPRFTSWGSYFSSVAQAAEDFETRVLAMKGGSRAA